LGKLGKFQENLGKFLEKLGKFPENLGKFLGKLGVFSRIFRIKLILS
jgi:hypothetical protein